MKLFTNFLICLIAGLLLNIHTRAQVSNCNVFVKNNYLEVGVNWNGAYGSSVPPPAGYHPDTLSHFYECDTVLATDTALGIVADPDKDGWNTGSPKYYGDYILPGTHQEGWSFMANGVQINEWNDSAGAAADSVLEDGTSVYETLFSSGPTGDTSIWEGYHLGLVISQHTIIDTSHMYIKVYVTLDNTGGISTLHNVYYMRTIKPNVDALLPGGGYMTKNKINDQLPNTLNTSVVSAASTVYPKAYLALGTNDSFATCFIIKHSAIPSFNTIDNIYAHSDTNFLYAANDSLINTGGIGIIFSFGDLPGSTIDTFSFVYALTRQAVGQGLNIPFDTTSAFPVDTTDTTHVVVNNLTKVHYTLYPNPVSAAFTVTGMNHTDNLVLYDEMGRNVSKSISNTGNNTFSTGNLPPGLYIVMITDKDGTVKWKTPMLKQ